MSQKSIWAKIFGSEKINDESSEAEVQQAATEKIQELEAIIADLKSQVAASKGEEVQDEQAPQATQDEATATATDGDGIDAEVEANEPSQESPTELAQAVAALQTTVQSLETAIADLQNAHIEAEQKYESDLSALTEQNKELSGALATLKAKGIQPKPSVAVSNGETLNDAIDKAVGAKVFAITGNIDTTERPK